MEIRYVTAKTVEEAMSKASAEYGNENDVSYEIVEMPKKGFLGIGASPAKIKVTYGGDDLADLAGIVSDIKKMKSATDRGYDDEPEAKKPQSQPKQQNQQRPQSQQRPQNQPRQERPQQRPQRPQNQPRPQQQPQVQVHESAPKYEPKPKTEVIVTPEEMATGIAFTKTLLANMKVDAKVEQDGDARIVISGETSSILIGHHGETLDAIQYLVNLCVCRSSETPQKEFVKIVVDVENYREKREETLRALARRMAAKAVKYKRNVLLEPMNPYERRIIHSEVQNIENVSTHSVGSDENRKIVITYEGADKVERRRRPTHRPTRPETASEPEEKLGFED